MWRIGLATALAPRWHQWDLGAAAGRSASVQGSPAHQQLHGVAATPPELDHCPSSMLLLSPFSPFTVAKIAGLQATVLLLITLLIKAQVQIKAASALGFFLLALQTLVFLAAAGALGLVAVGGAAGAMNCRPARTV